jgi:hypothetical protein
MPIRAFVTVEERSGEKSTALFWVQDISAANYGTVTQDIDEIKDAIATMIRGEIREVGFRKEFPESSTPVADELAQRETKWLVIYQDTTQFLDAANTITNPSYLKIFTSEIPTADITGNKIPAGTEDEVDLTEPVTAAFVTEFEANVRSPYNHSASAPTITVKKIIHVGRNN